jgi:hypothetical protein
MKNLASLMDLQEEMKARYPSISIEREAFDSAAEMLRIYHQDRYFVMVLIHLTHQNTRANEQYPTSFRACPLMRQMDKYLCNRHDWPKFSLVGRAA